MKVILFLFLLIFSYQITYSCTCEAPSQRKNFRKSEAVFVGKVLEIKESNNNRVADSIGMNKVYDITFEVEKSWKDKTSKQITVVSDNGYLVCGGFPFAVGKQYLVYAKGKDLIVISDCDRTVPIDAGEKDIKNLNSFWFRFFSRIIPF